jgi:Zn-dependent protease with chaperone function
MPASSEKSGSSTTTSTAPSLFAQQRGRRAWAKVFAFLIQVVACGLTGSFVFVLLNILAIYADFLSRLLPQPVTLLYARAAGPVTGVIGLTVATGVLTAGLWWWSRRIFELDTSAGLIWRLRARPPVEDDPHERYLAELTEWLATTAAAPVPAVLVFDGPVFNAAVIGDRPEAAAMLVSSELWRTLEPEENKAVAAHLLAVAINHDLAVNAALQRGFFMVGLSLTTLDIPFSSTARKTLALLWRYSRQSVQVSVDELGSSLGRALEPDGLESLTNVVRRLIAEETDWRSLASTLLLLPLLPFFLFRLAAGFVSTLLSILILSPLVALLLRSRRHQADATATALTRDPDSLARALIRIYEAGHVFPEAGRSELNFIVGPEAPTARVFDRLRARIAAAINTANTFNHRLRDRPRVGATMAAPTPSQNSPAQQSFVFGFHPPLAHRLDHLKKRGASLSWPDAPDRSTAIIAAVVGTTLVVATLLIFT